MKKIHKLTIIWLIALLMGVSSVIWNGYSNLTLKNAFEAREDAYPYEQAVMDHDIDLSEISKIVPTASAPLGYHYTNQITLPMSISYYENIEDTAPAYTIGKGKVIYFNVTEFADSGVTYRGMESLPTNKRGWRLAKPFEAEGESSSGRLLYVKLSDLEKVSRLWLDQNPQAVTALSSQIQGFFPTKQEYVHLLVLRLDQFLYEKGIYLSPDLKKPVLSGLTYVTFALALVIRVLEKKLTALRVPLSFYPQKSTNGGNAT